MSKTTDTRRGRLITDIGRRTPPGHLMTMCWCERRAKAVPDDDVAAGRTWSCGGDECRP